jgi:hypothetical protein
MNEKQRPDPIQAAMTDIQRPDPHSASDFFLLYCGAAAALTLSTHSTQTGPRVGTKIDSDSGLPRLHMRQIAIALVACGRSPGVVACRVTMSSQTATHSSQMKADEPSMSCRTALCGVLQNEQRCSRLLKKSNNESSRFTHIATGTLFSAGLQRSAEPIKRPG